MNRYSRGTTYNLTRIRALVDVFNTPDDIPRPDEEEPGLSDWESPGSVLTEGPIRERLLDVIMQVREPTTIAAVADRVDCDTETAREYLKWFASLGIVRKHSGPPATYERNESYLFWRRVETIRRQYSEEEIVEGLTQVVERIEAYRERYDAESPGAVSLVDSPHEGSIEDVREELSQWKTLE
ncbi:DUF7342 family protein [Salinigranum halophilum]|uniref:DUF7342 family protein n=1 Tax=Salinigranum halophilum TaxID=2565931 RepID=UPI0010A7E8E7|nr:hypothetical protein [Salinigranum halophilum]